MLREATEEDGQRRCNGGETVANTSFTVGGLDDVVWLGVYDRPTPANTPTGEVGSGMLRTRLASLVDK